MKIFPWLGLIALVFITGCATSTNKIVFDGTKRAATTSVDVVRLGEHPKREVKEIGELSFVGPAEDEWKALASFVSEGKKMGAQAIIIETPVPGSMRVGPFGAGRVFVFKCKVVVYEE